jgi:arsenate reductase-like glutaredoxin family protein
LLETTKAVMEERDVGALPLSPGELEGLIGPRDHKEFLNTRNELYRERKMKENPPSRKAALALMSEHPNLIRRPILMVDERVALGFDEKVWKEMLR